MRKPGSWSFGSWTVVIAHLAGFLLASASFSVDQYGWDWSNVLAFAVSIGGYIWARQRIDQDRDAITVEARQQGREQEREHSR